MGCNFYIKKTNRNGRTPVFVRIRSRKLHTDIKLSTGIETDARRWNCARTSPQAFLHFRATPDGKALFNKLEGIESVIDFRLQEGVSLTGVQARILINKVVFADEFAKREVVQKMTLNQYIDLYLKDIRSGRRQSDRGKAFAPATIGTISQALKPFAGFQQAVGREYGFDDIDMDFYNDFTAYLKQCGYSINTIGKCIKQFKAIMALSEAEGHHANAKYKDKRFKGPHADVDAIYLTREELDRIIAVPARRLSARMQLARDIFLIGVWTAQRVSDYNYLRPEDIHTTIRRWVDDIPDPDHPGKTVSVIREREITYIDIRQKKTGAKVSIPCSTELKRILEKYGGAIPHLPDQELNRHIKEIGRLAGLTEPVTVESSKGGRSIRERIPKYRLIHSHTARRTGATLMYLAGIDLYDIMKVTGHTTPAILKKYIKANNLEVVEKLSDKYGYFD